MSPATGSRSRRRVLVAAAAVAVLAALLGLRLLLGVRAPFASPKGVSPRQPAAVVATPLPVANSQLAFPCWACAESAAWPVAFRTDLDLLAPLGNGSGNAAELFGQFADPDGRRNADWVAASARSVDAPQGGGKKVLPPDDPLLLEAEPWCDQATMRFYPDVFPLDGWATRVPNFVVPLTLARSWAARGRAASDPEQALADFRRAIRLGRLLRQDGSTIIADLVGLAVLRLGTEGIYEHALRRGDSTLALTAAVVLSEIAPQRLLTSERVTRADLTPYLRRDAAGAVALELPDRRLDAIIAMATGTDEPRFRGEAILDLNLVRFLGAPEQRRRALAELERLATSTDPRISALAGWSRDTEPTKELLATLVAQSGGPSR